MAVRFSVLVNGSPSVFFQSSRGVEIGRPETPLFPQLFIIFMEVLSRLLETAGRGNYISGGSLWFHF